MHNINSITHTAAWGGMQQQQTYHELSYGGVISRDGLQGPLEYFSLAEASVCRNQACRKCPGPVVAAALVHEVGLLCHFIHNDL